ncbi:MAG: putative spermidine/putrescine transport system substrate-binding protein, partial [Gaiellaceae bacterium]|nr:putative spermidine/putrescine transport system substrate-binding protein [Gaiellaceae bacterium]
MHRRWLAGTLVVCALALAAAACGDAGNGTTATSGANGGTTTRGPDTATTAAILGGSMPTSIGAGEGALNLVARPGYAETAWVGAFQDETGCVVTATVAATSDEMVGLVRSGAYDGVSAPGDVSMRLVLAGDAAPVNVDLIRIYPELSGFLNDQP